MRSLVTFLSFGLASAPSLAFILLMPCLASAAGSDINPALLQGMKWRQIGPFRGGRVVAVSGVPGDPATWYFGGVAGGVWKSTDVGCLVEAGIRRAEDLLDRRHRCCRLGSQCRSMSAPGEACPRGNITYGDGVYKSVDAGRTWKNVGLRDTRHIGAVIVDPKNSRHRAGRGTGSRLRSERGARRIPQRRRRTDLDEGAVQGPRHRRDRRGIRSRRIPNIVFASLWQMRRQPWNFSSGGPGSGLYKSTDGGAHVEASRGTWLAAGHSRAASACRWRAGLRTRVLA